MIKRMIERNVNNFLRSPLRLISVLIVRYLQKRYKSISIKNSHSQTNQVLAKLKLIQAILYFFKNNFHAWGYFHPDCTWSAKDEKFFRKLFPEKDFKELEIVVWHNPEAVTYYQNKIWHLSKELPPDYAAEIKKQLIKWNNWD